ncbi:MAG: response regulator transcription factor [Candidatus Eremiobacteraeota bacterium]|nr:response regulator transcription factor [Candidatus Eremiobacteraeota bacterium]
MENSTPRVVVVDDEGSIRELLQLSLTHAGFVVRCASDGQKGLSLVREWQPDLIVLDVMLPKIDGISLLPLFRQYTEAPIVMLSAKGDAADKIAGLSRGADDYLSKPFDIPELVARLHTALRRPKLARAQTLRYQDLHINLETRTVTRANRRICLSAREYDLLVTLLRHPKRVYTRDQLLSLVWEGDGSERSVEPATVETYISYLRAKIDVGFNRRIIQTIRGVGYSLREEADV